MAEKEMTLMMRITANGDKAAAELKRFESRLNSMATTFGSWGRTAGGTFKAIGGVAGVVLAPLKLAAQAGLGVAAALTALGGAALKAAADDEKLIDRLTGVYGSAEKAKSVFEGLEKMSLRSAFKTDDLAEATIILEQVGLGGEKTLRSIAAGAKVAGMSVQDLAQSIGTLQMRGLKRIGISSEEKNGNTTFRFMDQARQWRTVVARGADEARAKLVDIMQMKFKGNIAPTTFSGWIQVFKNNLEEAFSKVGDGFLPVATRFVERISTRLTAFIESGKLEAWGEKIGTWLGEAADKLEAAFRTLPTVMEGIKNLWSGGELGTIMLETFAAGGRILGLAFYEMLKASMSIWVAVGKLIVEGMKPETIGTRKKIAQFFGSSDQELEQWEKDQTIRRKDTVNKIIKGSMTDIATALPNAITSIASITGTEASKLNKIFAGATGVNIGSQYTQNLAAVQAERPLSVAPRMGDFRKATDPWVEGRVRTNVGLQRPMAGAGIYIGRLNVNANNREEMEARLRESASRTPMAIAST